MYYAICKCIRNSKNKESERNELSGGNKVEVERSPQKLAENHEIFRTLGIVIWSWECPASRSHFSSLLLPRRQHANNNGIWLGYQPVKGISVGNSVGMANRDGIEKSASYLFHYDSVHSVCSPSSSCALRPAISIRPSTLLLLAPLLNVFMAKPNESTK